MVCNCTPTSYSGINQQCLKIYIIYEIGCLPILFSEESSKFLNILKIIDHSSLKNETQTLGIFSFLNNFQPKTMLLIGLPYLLISQGTLWLFFYFSGVDAADGRRRKISATFETSGAGLCKNPLHFSSNFCFRYS